MAKPLVSPMLMLLKLCLVQIFQVLSVMQHLIPRRKLAEMCLTGEPLSSAEALELGLVNYVDDDLDGKLQWLLDRLLDKSPAYYE